MTKKLLAIILADMNMHPSKYTADEKDIIAAQWECAVVDE